MHRFFYIILSILTLNCVLCIQRSAGQSKQVQPRGFVFETVLLPSKAGVDFYVSYRVEYNRLVFVKETDKFIARFSVSIEAVDSSDGKIYRESQKKEVTVDNFELTNAPHLYVQGIIKLNLKAGKYKVFPSVYDINTGSEHNLGQTSINTGNENNWSVNPLIVAESGSDQNNSYILTNYEGNIPFAREHFDLIIPVKDTTQTSLTVEIWNEDSLIIKQSLTDSFISSLELQQSDNNIALIQKSEQAKTRNFIIKDFNKSLREGGVRIKLFGSQKTKADTVFVKYVTWYNKPYALLNTEFAVKMLKYIASPSEIEEMQHFSDFKLYQALFDFWKKYDPTPQTAFNEIMEEYYQRVDYAINNFSIITARNGAETDRGKVYIKFGKPREIERAYNDSKDVKEIWHYDSPKRQFVFVDKSGLGNFVLNQSL